VKPIHIEFVEDRRWRWVWASAAVCAGLLMYGLFWQLGPVRQAHVETSDRLHALRQRLAVLRAPIPSKANPRQASVAQAAQSLQQDINQIFAAAENLQEPGVQLRSLIFDSGTTAMRLEYELDSLQKASTVTTLLNMGHDQKPWQLESVTNIGVVGRTPVTGLPALNVMPMQPTPQFRGIWSVDLKKL
jgi:hypothetical protein